MQKNKEKLLRILDILMKTDEENPVTANKIVEELRSYGIDAERKSVLRDISALREFGYDIILHHDNKLGYYFNDRKFEDWELKVLLDAVYSARFLTEKETCELAEHLYSQSSAAGQKTLRSFAKPMFDKSENRSVKYHINDIMYAVSKKKKITFQYEFTDIDLSKKLKRDGFRYTVSPYALYRRGDQYYMIANTDGYDNLSCYRLDRTKNLKITSQPARSAESIVGSNADIAVADYIRRTLYNFGGKRITLVLEIMPDAVDAVIDFFGNNIECKRYGEKTAVSVHTFECEGLYMWLLQFSGSVKAVSPKSVAAGMKKRIRDAAAAYGADLV